MQPQYPQNTHSAGPSTIAPTVSPFGHQSFLTTEQGQVSNPDQYTGFSPSLVRQPYPQSHAASGPYVPAMNGYRSIGGPAPSQVTPSSNTWWDIEKWEQHGPILQITPAKNVRPCPGGWYAPEIPHAVHHTDASVSDLWKAGQTVKVADKRKHLSESAECLRRYKDAVRKLDQSDNQRYVGNLPCPLGCPGHCRGPTSLRVHLTRDCKGAEDVGLIVRAVNYLSYKFAYDPDVVTFVFFAQSSKTPASAMPLRQSTPGAQQSSEHRPPQAARPLNAQELDSLRLQLTKNCPGTKWYADPFSIVVELLILGQAPGSTVSSSLPTRKCNTFWRIGKPVESHVSTFWST